MGSDCTKGKKANERPEQLEKKIFSKESTTNQRLLEKKGREWRKKKIAFTFFLVKELHARPFTCP